MFMELKGKLPNKIIRRGLFRNNHFDESCCFLSHETDKVTQRDKVANFVKFHHILSSFIGNFKSFSMN